MNTQDLNLFELFILAGTLFHAGVLANRYVKDKNGGMMPALRSPFTIMLFSFGNGTPYHDNNYCDMTKETRAKVLCDVIPIPVFIPNPFSFTFAMMSVGDTLIFGGAWLYAMFLAKLWNFIL
ncbi:MAG: DUF5317 family protein [Patescibacteria group bacterium]